MDKERAVIIILVVMLVQKVETDLMDELQMQRGKLEEEEPEAEDVRWCWGTADVAGASLCSTFPPVDPVVLSPASPRASASRLTRASSCPSGIPVPSLPSLSDTSSSYLPQCLPTSWVCRRHRCSDRTTC
jgi:hypothetical protein